MSDTALDLNSISRQLTGLDKPRKPKMLVVDDEPDNLDLLYRTFRRDFNVLRAESGLAALKVLATEGEVAVIISDQRMPEMKGTEFLSKTVPQFPDTMRIILTGFTDVEDLVEAINSGQVYRYITKPWDPGELKTVVQRAAETYELLKQRTEELRRAQGHLSLIKAIVQVAHQAASLEACLQLVATACAETFMADGCFLQLLEGDRFLMQSGYGLGTMLTGWNPDSLTTEAIATGKMQVAIADSANPQAAPMAVGDVPPLEQPFEQIGVRLVIPIVFQQETIALLALHWKQVCTLREDELALMDLAAQQVGITLACVRPVPAVV